MICADIGVTMKAEPRKGDEEASGERGGGEGPEGKAGGEGPQGRAGGEGPQGRGGGEEGATESKQVAPGDAEGDPKGDATGQGSETQGLQGEQGGHASEEEKTEGHEGQEQEEQEQEEHEEQGEQGGQLVATLDLESTKESTLDYMEQPPTDEFDGLSSSSFILSLGLGLGRTYMPKEGRT